MIAIQWMLLSPPIIITIVAMVWKQKKCQLRLTQARGLASWLHRLLRNAVRSLLF